MKSPSANPVRRLLRRNVSIPQLAGYALANMLGLAILLTAIQFYRDIKGVWSGDDPLISRDYLILSKEVKGGMATLFTGTDTEATSFIPSEIAGLESQPWCGKVGKFTAAQCNVSASVGIGARSMSTYLFLESIPDEFFDVRPADWHFHPGKDTTVPIIISKDYLALYNYGFAPSRGLPQISESTVSMVPLRLTLSGRGETLDLKARIVGFSSRLNTIAVPQEFMDWANSTFGTSSADRSPAPARLIVETATPGDPAIERYLSAHGFEAAGDKATGGRAAYFLRVMTGVVGAIGAVISLLALFILLLSIWLLMQKNREKLHQLMTLGYSPSMVASHYIVIVFCVNLAVYIGASAVLTAVAGYWQSSLASIGVAGGSVSLTLLCGAAIIALITLVNILAIRRKMTAFWRG